LNLAALYVYWVILGWIFITSLGLPPIPEEVAVAGLGAWVHQNPDAFWLFSWLICIGAVLGTDLFLYGVGRLGGHRLLRQKYVQKAIKPERIHTFSRKFQEKGVWFMLTARLIPGWRTAVFITAGSIRYPVNRFVLADAISSVPLVTFFFFGGYLAADWINDLINRLHHTQNVIFLVVFLAAVILGLILYIHWMRRRQIEEAAEEAEEKEKIEQQKIETAPVTPDAHSAVADGHNVTPAAHTIAPSANGAHASSGASRPVHPQS